jgi:hypothetical protein
MKPKQRETFYIYTIFISLWNNVQTANSSRSLQNCSSYTNSLEKHICKQMWFYHILKVIKDLQNKCFIFIYYASFAICSQWPVTKCNDNELYKIYKLATWILTFSIVLYNIAWFVKTYDCIKFFNFDMSTQKKASFINVNFVRLDKILNVISRNFYWWSFGSFRFCSKNVNNAGIMFKHCNQTIKI